MIELIYSNTIQLGTINDRQELLNLANHSEMGSNDQLVYVYSLGGAEPDFQYPLRAGRTLYIGETKRQTGAGKRFGGHISTSLTEGLSTLINHTLSVYYHSGKPLDLRVFKVTDGRKTIEAERVLLRSHLHEFGSYPIGQGSSGRDNTPKEISRIFNAESKLHYKCSALLGV